MKIPPPNIKQKTPPYDSGKETENEDTPPDSDDDRLENTHETDGEFEEDEEHPKE